MKYALIIRSIAMATTLLTMPTPGFAAIDVLGTNPVLDQQCNDQLNPSDNSDFTTYAVIVGSPDVSSSTVDTGPTIYVGIGLATSVLGNYRQAHVNGKSVNIHAYGDRVVTYAAGANGMTPTLTTVTTTTNASCHVHKPTPGNSPTDTLHDGFIAPPGLQDLVASSTTSEMTPGTRSSSIPGPWIDLANSVYGGEFVICISPSTTLVKGNPGAWRGQNGYVSQIDGRTCTTAWHDSLGSSVSVSLPPV